MKLHKEIFNVIEQNSAFLLYLYNHPEFTVQEICEEFDLHYQSFFYHLKAWIKQGYIVSKKLPPELGGVKYTYSLSEKAIKKLKSLKEMLSQDLK